MSHSFLVRAGVGVYVEALVSDCDAEFVNRYSWHLTTKDGYVARLVTIHENGRRKQQHRSLHRLLLQPDASVVVDHINSNRLDNRRENLRLADTKGNAANRRPTRHNTSGYKHVTWHSKSGKWQVAVASKYVGLFGSPEAAARAADDAAKRAYGEFAWLNFPESP